MKSDIDISLVPYEQLVSGTDFDLDRIIYDFDIVNIGLHFFLKNVRPYAASCSEA